MKKLLIVEGIATSGKSSLIKAIIEQLGHAQVRVYTEAETHMPIIDDVHELHVQFFKALVEDALQSEAALVIFDRLHFTQAFRAKAGIAPYGEVEEVLLGQDALVAYLQVDESAIKERVEFSAQHPRVALATEHSGANWGEYITSKGQTFDEVAAYYADQQRHQLELLDQSKLKSRIFNTTHHDYPAIASQIIGEWFDRP